MDISSLRFLAAAACVIICMPCGQVRAASKGSGASKVVSTPFLLPLVVYYGGVTAKNVGVGGGPVPGALELTAPATGKNAWDEAAQEKLPVTIRSGDSLITTFSIRAIKPASGAVVVFNAEGGPPAYIKAVSHTITLTTTWQKVRIPFKTTVDLAAHAGDFDFFLDTVAQTVQVANFRVVDLGQAPTGR